MTNIYVYSCPFTLHKFTSAFYFTRAATAVLPRQFVITLKQNLSGNDLRFYRDNVIVPRYLFFHDKQDIKTHQYWSHGSCIFSASVVV